MRYVVGVCILTGLIIWDGVYYNGRYLDASIKSVKHAVDYVANMV